eukprot:8844985-Lingulodinium_polyedra.AAC.1
MGQPGASGGVGVTGEMALRLLRDTLGVATRRAAVAEAQAREERLRQSAGSETRTLRPAHRAALPDAGPT